MSSFGQFADRSNGSIPIRFRMGIFLCLSGISSAPPGQRAPQPRVGACTIKSRMKSSGFRSDRYFPSPIIPMENFCLMERVCLAATPLPFSLVPGSCTVPTRSRPTYLRSVFTAIRSTRAARSDLSARKPNRSNLSDGLCDRRTDHPIGWVQGDSRQPGRQQDRSTADSRGRVHDEQRHRRDRIPLPRIGCRCRQTGRGGCRQTAAPPPLRFVGGSTTTCTLSRGICVHLCRHAIAPTPERYISSAV